LGVASNALKRMIPTTRLLRCAAGLTADRALSYAAVGDRVFYANGAEEWLHPGWRPTAVGLARHWHAAEDGGGDGSRSGGSCARGYTSTQ